MKPVSFSSSFALAIKVICVNVTIALLIVLGASFGIAQAQEQQTGMDGGLSATLNRENFTAGDTITVNGTVQERESNSYVSIEVYDPQRRTVERELVHVSADGKFTYSFVAGAQAEFDPDFWMQNSGKYTMVVRYTPPGLSLDSDIVEFGFNYNSAAVATSNNNTIAGEASTDSTRGISHNNDNITMSKSVINPTAVNQSAAQAIRYTELAYISMQNNDSRDVLANLSLALDELYDLQGNLIVTLTASPQSSNVSENTDNSTTQIRDADDNNTTVVVSIAPGPSSLTDILFQPNPVRVNIGDTVEWANRDSIPHTVTSNQNISSDKQFDSGVLAPNSTFEHTFTEVGEYSYSCTLHPNHAGTVIVS